jgi:hypothetical protein
MRGRHADEMDQDRTSRLCVQGALLRILSNAARDHQQLGKRILRSCLRRPVTEDARISAEARRVKFVIIDIEASHFDGFPIEIGWADQDGNAESHLIRPLVSWTLWSSKAEQVHGISREKLAAEGEPAGAVASRVADLLARWHSECVTVASDNPAYDGPWLEMLLRAGGIRERRQLEDVAKLHQMAVSRLFEGLGADDSVIEAAARGQTQARAEGIIKAVKDWAKGQHHHRAADDAKAQVAIIREIQARIAQARD